MASALFTTALVLLCCLALHRPTAAEQQVSRLLSRRGKLVQQAAMISCLAPMITTVAAGASPVVRNVETRHKLAGLRGCLQAAASKPIALIGLLLNMPPGQWPP
jgi:hypothetical protein